MIQIIQKFQNHMKGLHTLIPNGGGCRDAVAVSFDHDDTVCAITLAVVVEVEHRDHSCNRNWILRNIL